MVSFHSDENSLKRIKISESNVRILKPWRRKSLVLIALGLDMRNINF